MAAQAGRLNYKFSRNLKERAVEAVLMGCGMVAVFPTVAIVWILVSEAIPFFEHVSLATFLTDTMWTPLFAEPRFGILPLVSGTLTMAAVALSVAITLAKGQELVKPNPATEAEARMELGWLKPGETKSASWLVKGAGEVTVTIGSTRGGVDSKKLVLN